MSDITGKKVHIINERAFYDEYGGFFSRTDHFGTIIDKFSNGYLIENIETKKTHKVKEFSDIKILDDDVDLQEYVDDFHKEEEKKDYKKRLDEYNYKMNRYEARSVFAKLFISEPVKP